jgi:endonuclease/exonuclease/phosphatase family metal-dependent hydrolase
MKARTTEIHGPALWYRPIWWLNLLVVAGLLLAYLSVRVDPATCWPLALFGMGYPYILGANLLCILWWLVFRRRRAWLSLLVILLGWNYLGEYVQFVGDRRTPQDVGTPFTLMSWNVRLFDLYNWTHNQQTRDEMMDLIRVEDPDILCMQEFLHVDGGNPLDVKAPLLNNYRFTACADSYTAHARGYHMGIAIFSTWPIVAQGTLHFPDELNNLCLWADLRIGADTVRVYTAHLASLRFGDPDYAFMRSIDQGGGSDSLATAGPRIMARLKDAFIRRSREVARITEHMRTCPWPIVYCGDLNDTPMSYSYHRLRRAGLEDAFVESGQGFGHTYIGEFPSFRIDHLLHGPQVKAWGMRTLPDELSDHRPVVCSMGVARKGE